MLIDDPLDVLAGVVDLLVELVVPAEDLSRSVWIHLVYQFQALVVRVGQRLLEHVLIQGLVRMRGAGPLERIVRLFGLVKDDIAVLSSGFFARSAHFTLFVSAGAQQSLLVVDGATVRYCARVRG
mmetsp:Transcript_41029/g.53784  ORF Transcript_41029/g.53784 Transcript_41029/m.53784 type:complete len:125 (-) Transcript_41029:3-377(-)